MTGVTSKLPLSHIINRRPTQTDADYCFKNRWIRMEIPVSVCLRGSAVNIFCFYI